VTQQYRDRWEREGKGGGKGERARPYLAMGQGGATAPPEKLASEYNKILFVHSS